MTVTIYHTNDMHNHPAPIEKLAGVEKDASTLILDAGDALAGSNTVFKIKEPILDMMNRAKYDAMTMGNREFNYLRWALKLRAEQADFPILCANLEDPKHIAENYFKPSVVIPAGPIKVGVFGLTPVQYGDDSLWRPFLKFRFLDPFEKAREMAAELKRKADVVIFLSHLGLPDDRKMAENVEGIHIIIGGHSHDLLEKPIVAGKTYIFQAGSHGSHYGKIRFDVEPDDQGSIKNLDYQIVKV